MFLSTAACCLMLSPVAIGAQSNCEGDFGHKCTLERIDDADVDENRRYTKDERRMYFAAGDYIYSQVLQAAKSLPTQARDQLTEPLFEQFDSDFCFEFPCEQDASLSDLREFAVARNGPWKSKKTLLAGLKLSRTVKDAADPRGGGGIPARPVVFSYRHDRESGEEGLQVLGNVTMKPWVLSETDSTAWTFRPEVALDLDSFASNRGRNKSEIGIKGEFAYSFGDWEGTTHVAGITPTYFTDGDFGRDVVALSASYSLTSNAPRLGRPGKQICLTKGCPAESWIFYWSPSLTIQYGDVRDASGNASLEATREKGAYMRWIPSLGLRLRPFFGGVTIGLDLQGIHDNKLDSSFGYLEGSVAYDIAQNVALTAVYRRGRKASTLEPLDYWLLGLGVQF